MGEVSNKQPFNVFNMAVSKYRSVKRAIRRGHVSPIGVVYPNRPFNNRTSKKGSRPFNDLKKSIYGQYKDRRL